MPNTISEYKSYTCTVEACLEVFIVNYIRESFLRQANEDIDGLEDWRTNTSAKLVRLVANNLMQGCPLTIGKILNSVCPMVFEEKIRDVDNVSQYHFVEGAHGFSELAVDNNFLLLVNDVASNVSKYIIEEACWDIADSKKRERVVEIMSTQKRLKLSDLSNI